MSFFAKETQNSTFASASYSAGLRSHFMLVYNYMSSALALTGIVSYCASQSSTLIQLLFSNPILMLLFAFAPMGLILYMGSKMQSMSLSSLVTCLMIYAGLVGISIAPIFLIYTGASIAKTFFISSSVFGLTSLYGYTTKKDLTSVGSFAMMGVIGILFASIVNIFLKSTALDFFVSILGVVLFTALAAWDTQKIKDIYFAAPSDVKNSEMMKKLATMSALSLYMDFLNIFLFLLRFFGDRKEN